MMSAFALNQLPNALNDLLSVQSGGLWEVPLSNIKIRNRAMRTQTRCERPAIDAAE